MTRWNSCRCCLKMSIFRLTQRVIFSTLCISTVTSIQLFMVDTTFSTHFLVIAFFSAAITIYLLMPFADQSTSGKVQPRYKFFKADTKSFSQLFSCPFCPPNTVGCKGLEPPLLSIYLLPRNQVFLSFLKWSWATVLQDLWSSIKFYIFTSEGLVIFSPVLVPDFSEECFLLSHIAPTYESIKHKKGILCLHRQLSKESM